jgi:hypothetical protein
MAIQATSGKLHWNYFIALERDLEVVSRYVEFTPPNFDVYSIALAHLLFAAASEVDVIAKLLCQQSSPSQPRGNINQYRSILLTAFPTLPTMQVVVPRYGLTLTPWANWAGPDNPDWWRSYNNVKHERDAHFQEATLTNALNAMGALLLLTYIYYSHSLAPAGIPRLSAKDTTRELQPESTLIRLPESFYYDHIVS